MAKHVQLTPRDFGLFDWLNRHGAATCPEIAREFFGSESRAYRRLLALREGNYIRADRDLTALPAVYRVTAAGAGLVSAELSAPKKNLPKLVHTVELVELYQWLLEEETEIIEEYYTERELLQREREATEQRRAADGAKKLSRTPDGLIVDFMGQNIAIELELVPKRAANYKRIFQAYEEMLAAGKYDSIRYYVRGPQAARRLERIAFSKHSFEEGQIQFFAYAPVYDMSTSGQGAPGKRGKDKSDRPVGGHTPPLEVESVEEAEERMNCLLQCADCGVWWRGHDVCEYCGENLW